MKIYLQLAAFLLPFLSTTRAKGILAAELSKFGIDYAPVERKLEQMKEMVSGTESDMGSAGLEPDNDPYCEKCMDDGTWVSVNRRMGTAQEMLDGDIVLRGEQADEIFEHSGRSKRKVASPFHDTAYWDASKPIAYDVGGGLSTKALNAIQEGIKHWEEMTCLRFALRTDEINYIQFIYGSGCYSTVVGRDWRNQVISIGTGCESKRTVSHEIGHAMGFFHEQARPDRDKYIRVIYPNIKPQEYYQFRKYDKIDYHGIPYNYLSIMHYSGWAFSKTDGMTIRTIDANFQYEIGRQNVLHPCDAEQINNLYCRDPPEPPKDPIHCKVSNWGRWNRCRNGCSLKVRTRKVLTHPTENGNLCPPLKHMAICRGHCRAKKRNCQVTPWNRFSRCSKCGLGTFGTRTRTRRIKKNRKGKGRICPPLRQSIKCANQPCCRPNV